MTNSNSSHKKFPTHSLWLLLVFALLFAVLSVYLADASASGAKKLKPGDPYALIFGTVWGPDNRPVYGVKVNIRRVADKKAKWEVYSDHAGEFAQRIPAGKADYVISADLKHVTTADGHALHLAQEITLHVEYDERQDMSLHLTQ